MNIQWRQQHYNNSCASACLAMLLGPIGIRKQDADIIRETCMQYLVLLNREHNSYEAGVLVHGPRYFNIMLSRYGLRFNHSSTSEWSDYIERADSLLNKGQPFMTGVNPALLPGSLTQANRGGSHAIVVYSKHRGCYNCLDPDSGLDRSVEHDFEDVEHRVCFALSADELHEAVTSRNKGYDYVLGVLEPAASSSDESAVIKQESLNAVAGYAAIAQTRLEHLPLDEGIPDYQTFYRYILEIVKPVVNDLLMAIEVSNPEGARNTRLIRLFQACKKDVLRLQSELKAGTLGDWEQARSGLNQMTMNVQEELQKHIASWRIMR